jgi:hypothetical protein
MLWSRRLRRGNGKSPMVLMTRAVSAVELLMMVIKRRERRCDLDVCVVV